MAQEDLYNLTIEKSILSSMIFDPKQFDAYSSLSVSHFYLPAHQDIYRAMSSLAKKGAPIDEEFIKIELERAGRFDELIMLDILSANPISNLNYYIDTLSTHKNKRELLSLTNEIKKAVLEDDLSAAKNLLMKSGDTFTADKRMPVISALTNVKEEETEFILKEWLPFPKNTVSLVTAPGGSGKSWIILQLATRFCNANKSNKAFLWLSEDPEGLSLSRFNKIASSVLKMNESTINDVKNRLHISNSPTPTLITEQSNRKLAVDPIWHELKKVFDNYNLIVLDPLIAFFGGDENNNGHARFFMQLFTEYASKNNKTIIFIHHSAKGTAGARGAGAIVDAARLHYEVERITTGKEKEIDDSKSHMRLLRLAKDNYNAGSVLKSSTVERQIFPDQIKNKTNFDLAFEKVEIGFKL
jgi:replicative DNA helicase